MHGIIDMKTKTETKTKTVTVEAKRILRDAQGKFLKGSACPSGGRPPLGETRLDKLLGSIRRVESKKNKTLLDHYIFRAFKSDMVLCSVMKKLHPDLQAVAALTVSQEMNDAMAESIRQTIAKRFES